MKKFGKDILTKKYKNCKTMEQYFNLINSNKIDYHTFFTAISKNKKTDCFRFVTNIKNLNVKIQYKFQKLLGIKLKLSEIKLRAYFMGSGIGLHKDKSPWDYSCSLNVYTKYFGSFMRQIPSSLNFIDYNGKKIKLQQNIGDAILYDGLKLEHWREPMNTNNRKDVQFQLLFAYTTDTKDTKIKRIKPKIYNRTRND